MNIDYQMIGKHTNKVIADLQAFSLKEAKVVAKEMANTPKLYACEAYDVVEVNKKAKKPPIGLKPKKIVDEERFLEVCAAISRYYNDEREIPVEWVEEYNQLIKSK